jgi:hypothetical protein
MPSTSGSPSAGKRSRRDRDQLPQIRPTRMVLCLLRAAQPREPSPVHGADARRVAGRSRSADRQLPHAVAGFA